MNSFEAAEKIKAWISSKVAESGARGAVIGMSGGIDSSTASALAVMALGKKNVLGLILPCESSKKDERLAQLVAKKFGIRANKIDITPFYMHMKKMLPAADRKTLGNLKARLRMAVLYYFANKYNYLVIGSANRSEIWIGYFTKYGDGAADILPLGGLYKTQVIELAKYIGVPEEIIKAEPSAGLWKGQTDRKEIGMDYSQLDLILWSMERGSVQNPKRSKRVMDMVKYSRHKRKMPDICEV